MIPLVGSCLAHQRTMMTAPGALLLPREQIHGYIMSWICTTKPHISNDTVHAYSRSFFHNKTFFPWTLWYLWIPISFLHLTLFMVPLFLCTWTEETENNREIFLLLVHSPNAWKIQEWAKLVSDTHDTIWIPCIPAEAQSLASLFDVPQDTFAGCFIH